MLYNPYALATWDQLPSELQRDLAPKTMVIGDVRFIDPNPVDGVPLDVTIAAFGEQFVRAGGFRISVTIISLDPSTFEVRFNGPV